MASHIRSLINPSSLRSLYRKQYRMTHEWRRAWTNFRCSGAYWILRRSVRAVQISVVAAAIYGAGYSSGAIALAAEKQAMITPLLSGNNAQSLKSVSGVDADEHQTQHQRIKDITSRIVNAATSICSDEISRSACAAERANSRILSSMHGVFNKTEIVDLYDMLDTSVLELERWNAALYRVSGEWTVDLTMNKEEINAYVSEVVPRRLFVEYGLLHHMSPNDDEMAMIIGHELSHCMLSHSSQELQKNATARMVQLIFLSCVDPSGIFSMMLELLSFEVCAMFSSYWSKNNEYEADSLGQKIMTYAEFEAAIGSSVFLKESMFESAVVKAGSKRRFAWRDSHPDSADRYYRLAAERAAACGDTMQVMSSFASSYHALCYE
jgi:Zn-dependent protease with chaperone function